jgi:thioredoxin-like negative regulator of GroEL
MGDHAGAEKLLRAAMEQLPDDAGVRCHIGSTYVSLGRKEEARSVLRRCVEDSPEEAMRRHAEVLLGDL